MTPRYCFFDTRMVRRAVCLTSWMAVALLSAVPAFAVPEGYTARTIPLNAPPAGLSFDANGVLYALESASFGSNGATIRVIHPDDSFGTNLPVVGDDPGNFFVGGMTYDPIDNRLLITDNTSDGRIYSVDALGVQQTIAMGIPAIAGVAVRSTGEIFVSTALGNNMGQVLQVDRQNGNTTVVASGLDFGAGLALDTNGDLLVQEADSSDFSGRVHRLPITENGANLIFGSLSLLIDDMQSSAGLVVDSEGDIFSSGSGGLFSILGTPLTELSFSNNGSPTQFATALAFDAGSQPFEPFAGPDAGRLALMADFSFGGADTFVTLIEPLPPEDANFNDDLTVDGVDLSIWEQNFGTASGATNMIGDADGDEDVDGLDFLIWQQQFGSGALVAPQAVPEPTSCLLAAGLALFALGRRLRL